jgi:putative transposase
MRDYKNLAHTRWDGKYHIVFIPKKRRKIIFGTLRKHLGEIFHELARQKGVVIEEGHLI